MGFGIQGSGEKRGVIPLFPLILTPEEWNRVVDALSELDGRTPAELKCGLITFTGDGTTTSFKIPHGLTETPTVAFVGKASSGLPDVDYWTVDSSYITVVFKTAPSSGSSVSLWWMAIRR